MSGDLIVSRSYWRDPCQVFAGLTWLVVGFVIGVLI